MGSHHSIGLLHADGEPQVKQSMTIGIARLVILDVVIQRHVIISNLVGKDFSNCRERTLARLGVGASRLVPA